MRKNMLAYHAAYYHGEKEWIVALVLDFPGAASQGRTLQSARRMIRDALREMAEALLEDGQPLPPPNPKAGDKKAMFQELLGLDLRIHGGKSHETTQANSALAKKRLQRVRRKTAHPGACYLDIPMPPTD
jgi:predicted RNase H-like HicB family nuclease